MGLLDAVLGSVLGGGQQQAQGGGGSAMLMQIVAAMLANKGGGGAGAGGLGAALEGLGVGGNGGGPSLGGLAGLAEQFTRSGMGDVMNSWIGKGENQAISPDQLGGVLGGDLLSELTQRTGMGQGDLLGQLSQMLPQMVDRATPEGRIPEGGLGDIGAILAQFGGGAQR